MKPFILMAVMLSVIPATQIQAQDEELFCQSHDFFVFKLADGYSEVRQSIATNHDDTLVVEIFANEETGSWTMLTTDPDGVSCVVWSGFNFEVIRNAILPNTDDPT